MRINTLTPVHTGTGTELQGNYEYLYFSEERCIAVIDAEKVLNILGEENLGHWISCIEHQQSLLALLEKRKHDLTSSDIAIFTIVADKGTDKPIRTQLRSGNSNPIIAGSSLKGAIRTAVWAELLLETPNLVKNKHNLGNVRGNNKFSWSDQAISRTLFGQDPNHDIFRLLQVGDITCAGTRIYETNAVNKKYDRWEIKRDITQFVEAIPPGNTGIGHFKFNDVLARQASDYFNRNKKELTLSELFPLINSHTRRLVEDEIEYWDEKQGNPDVLGQYVDTMEEIIAALDGCQENECVLRLGWGSGFRAMTGDWQGIMRDEDYYDLVKSLRPRHPDDLVFPKSMRFVAGGVPMGFVKISLTTE